MSARHCFQRAGVLAGAAAVLMMAGPAWACPPDEHGDARPVGKTSARVSDAVKNVELVGNVADAKDAISLNFLTYGRRTVLFATGRFGLKAYDITADATRPRLVGELNMRDPDDPTKTMWETEDTEVDARRKLIFLARDPRAFGGNTQTGESGIYIVDARAPENLKVISYTKTPTGHTTSCVNDCQYLWTGGPAKADSMPAEWGGRPVWVTDIRNPREPKTFPDPVDTARNDGKTDYVHDIQVDARRVAWASGRGGVRGYWTDGLRWDPVKRTVRRAKPWDPVPYAGGGISETGTFSAFMHNSFRPVGPARGQAADPRRWGNGRLIYVTEETFNPGCDKDGVLVISSLAGSYGGQGWHSTPENKFRLRTVGTWAVAGQEGSRPDTEDCSAHYFAVRDGILVQSFYAQGTRFLDVTDPTKPTQVAYFRPDNTRSWQPYWHGRYVYVADHVRGIDILKPLL